MVFGQLNSGLVAANQQFSCDTNQVHADAFRLPLLELCIATRQRHPAECVVTQVSEFGFTQNWHATN